MKNFGIEILDGSYTLNNSISFDPSIYNDVKIVGLGATVLNGYSYEPFERSIKIYTGNKDLDGFRTFVVEMIYLENYNTVVGYEESNISSPERNICDYLMYSDRLHADLYAYDAVEGYIEEYGNLEKVYEMMNYFGIPKEALERYIRGTQGDY